jgi:predicted alpha/beta superfamily hydrolase
MKKTKLLIILLLYLSVTQLSAQVTFVIQSLPANTPATDYVYIAGDFTGWQPGSAAYKMQKNGDGKWSITLAAQPNGTVYLYKFTRGSWETVEKGSSGEEIANRSFTFGNGSTVDIFIANWADGGSSGTSTAASNVKIISTDFFMPQLNRTRRIWMYFPPDYETSGLSYPVLYMHDGQNLFDNLTSFAGEWQVDETLNTMAGQGKRVPLVVGIDNGGINRIGEYTPWANLEYGGGDGEKYMQFIVETLKPFIDQNYRTLPGRENTGIMGSSLGGLISHYGSLQFQSTFSKAGLFSPSYWFSDSIWTFTHDIGKQHEMRFYQMCGTNEGSSTAESNAVVTDLQHMNDSLVKTGFAQNNISNKIVEGGQHNESLWRDAFGEAYLWLFDSFITSVAEQVNTKDITCSPNPVLDELTFRTSAKINFDTVLIIDMNGGQVKKLNHPRNNKIDVHDLQPGTYVLRCLSGGIKLEGKFVKK